MANIFKKIKKKGNEAVQKAQNASKISKISNLIQSELTSQENVYTEIGRQYYAAAKANSELREPFNQLFLSIAQSCDKVASYQAEILKIKNVKQCPKCGRECSFDSVFCAGCGLQLPQEEKETTGNHCIKCGVELASDDAFCFNCGNKVGR